MANSDATATRQVEPMRRVLVFAALALVLASRILAAQTGAKLAFRYRGPGSPLGDSTELALIGQLKALYPGEDGLRIEQQLMSESVYGMRISNPNAQAVVDRIFARRKAAFDSAEASRPKPVDVGPLLHVTVALVASLSDPTASAELRRRTNIDPHDVILIPAAHATVRPLEAAIHRLGELWKADGQLTPSKDTSEFVHGEMHIESWTQLNEDLMTGQLMEAATYPPATVSGVGDVRSFVTVLRHH